MLMVLPALASVHCAASGQLAQADPKVATCVPVPAGRIVVVTPAGQRTVRAATSTANWSLAKRPAGAVGGCTLQLICAPAASSVSSSFPAP